MGLGPWGLVKTERPSFCLFTKAYFFTAYTFTLAA